MQHLSFLLGAGFSVAAGYPTAKELNQRLSNLKANEIDIHSSGEAWFNNGKPNPNQWLKYKENLFIEKYTQWYVDELLQGRRDLFDYEKFYDFTKQLKRGQIKIDRFDKFRKQFTKEMYNSNKWPDTGNLLLWYLNTFNQLVSNLLYKKEDNIFSLYFDPRYEGFLNFIHSQLKHGSVHVHTLNHDLLFENLSNSYGLADKFNDGFEEIGSPFYGSYQGYNIRLKRYTDNFLNQRNLALYKLHGSVNQYIYSTEDETYALKVPPSIFVTELYMERVKNEGDLYYHNYPWNYYSDFLTGTKEKIKRYKDVYYYKSLFQHFSENLKNSNHLFVIGYGFRDVEINRYIHKYFLSRKGTKMIVIDPYPKRRFTSSNVYYIKRGVSDVNSNIFKRLMKIS